MEESKLGKLEVVQPAIPSNLASSHLLVPVDRSWTISFDQNRPVVLGSTPTNVGMLPLFDTDDTNLLAETTVSKQRLPTVIVQRIMAGSVGNPREDDVDLQNIKVQLDHSSRPRTSIGMQEVQVLRCNATSGSFKLRFNGSKTKDIYWNSSAAYLRAALEALEPLARVNVSIPKADTVCSNSGSNLPHRVVIILEPNLGDAEEFVILKNSDMNNDDAQITVIEEMKGGVEVSYLGGKSGRYRVTYVPTIKGHYNMWIRINPILKPLVRFMSTF